VIEPFIVVAALIVMFNSILIHIITKVFRVRGYRAVRRHPHLSTEAKFRRH
jgi:hypothetical protein